MSRRSATPMRSRRIICARPAPFPIRSSPTTACWKLSCRCFIAANTTSSGLPTRRSRNSKPRSARTAFEPPTVCTDMTATEDAMDSAIDRIMQTYELLVNQTAAASAEARAKVTEYVAKLFEAGETDTHRLTVCGLTYLRELDGSNDPVKAGFTGL